MCGAAMQNIVDLLQVVILLMTEPKINFEL